MTALPSAASLRAMASPIPRLPPVTRVDRVMGGHLPLTPGERTGVDGGGIGCQPWTLAIRSTRVHRLPAARARRRRPAAGHRAGRPARRLPCRTDQAPSSSGSPMATWKPCSTPTTWGWRYGSCWMAPGGSPRPSTSPEDAAAARRRTQAVEVARVAAAINSERIELADEPGYGEVTWVSVVTRRTRSRWASPTRSRCWRSGARGCWRTSGIDHVDASLHGRRSASSTADGGTTASSSGSGCIPVVHRGRGGRRTAGSTPCARYAPPAGRGYEYLTGTGWDFAGELAELPELLAAKLRPPRRSRPAATTW